MRTVAPRIAGLVEHQYNGDEFKSVTFAEAMAANESGQVTGKFLVTRWKLNDQERAEIAAGGDLFVLTLNILPAIQIHVNYPYGPLEP